MGVKKGFYANDLWNIEYLHKFKWNHLTDEMAYQQRVKRVLRYMAARFVSRARSLSPWARWIMAML